MTKYKYFVPVLFMFRSFEWKMQQRNYIKKLKRGIFKEPLVTLGRKKSETPRKLNQTQKKEEVPSVVLIFVSACWRRYGRPTEKDASGRVNPLRSPPCAHPPLHVPPTGHYTSGPA